MDAIATWDRMINSLTSEPKEYHIKLGKWFKASTDRDTVCIEPAVENSASCEVSSTRKIKQNEFVSVFAYYDRWINKEPKIRQKARDESQNTSYIFALIGEYR